MDAATAIMLAELEAVRQGEARGWWRVIEIDEVTPSFTVSMTSNPTQHSPGGDEYVWLVECDGYRAQPPFFHCVDPRTHAVDTKAGFPRGGDSFFNEHGGKPVICNQFNRGAYQGIHKGDWGPQVGNWEAMAGPVNSTLAGMLAAIRFRIRDETYKGPWEPRT